MWLVASTLSRTTRAVVLPRLAALLERWDELRSLESFDRQLHAESLDEVIEWHHAHLFLVWANGFAIDRR